MSSPQQGQVPPDSRQSTLVFAAVLFLEHVHPTASTWHSTRGAVCSVC